MRHSLYSDGSPLNSGMKLSFTVVSFVMDDEAAISPGQRQEPRRRRGQRARAGANAKHGCQSPGSQRAWPRPQRTEALQGRELPGAKAQVRSEVGEDRIDHVEGLEREPRRNRSATNVS